MRMKDLHKYMVMALGLVCEVALMPCPHYGQSLLLGSKEPLLNGKIYFFLKLLLLIRKFFY